MDQLKDFLKQCVKYRFWIAFGVSLILPMVGYFVGVGGIVEAQTKAEASIKAAKSDISKYTTRGIVNGQYQPLAAQKNAVLTKDVDASWRKLRALQEPLLRWPEEVEAKFTRWGRKYPTDVDQGEVTRTLQDYTYTYPAFVSKIYKIFKPFNYEDGTGIVVAPDEASLLHPAAFSIDNAPELAKVWAEQERIWVLTAVLDAIAKINDTVKAKDWDGAIVKQINLLEVGSATDLDQKSTADGVTLVPSDPIVREGAPVTAAPAAPVGGALPGGPGGPGANANNSAGEVFYLKSDSKQFKTLPIKLTVLVEQSKLADYLVGLENSPITIQVMEVEVVKPSSPITKPAMGERTNNFGSGGKMGPGESMGGTMVPGGNARNMGRGPGMPGGGKGMNEAMGPGNMMSGPGGNANTTKGVDGRSVNKQQQRKDEKNAANKKAEPKAKVDTHYNIVEVTVYGQARFYLAPPPLPAATPSTSASVPSPEAPKTEPAKTVTPEPTADTKKADETKPAQPPTTKTDEAPKADASKTDASKTDASKTDAPKSDGKTDAPKSDAAKGEVAPPKS